jgi:corticotropin releasing hormone receptor 1
LWPSENATRLCFSNGSWDQYSNYTSCKELSPLEGPEVELTTTIYFIGYTVSLVALLFAVYIFWKFKWVESGLKKWDGGVESH